LSLTCFALGIALLLGTFNVFFRDVKYFYEAGPLAWFYATPIFYPAEIIPSKFKFRYCPYFDSDVFMRVIAPEVPLRASLRGSVATVAISQFLTCVAAGRTGRLLRYSETGKFLPTCGSATAGWGTRNDQAAVGERN
jgi:hypothetical protein